VGETPSMYRAVALLFVVTEVRRSVTASFRQMPSRQERLKAERDAAKAGAKAGAAGSAAAHVHENPDGEWTTQAADCGVLLRALGTEVVKGGDEGNCAVQSGVQAMCDANGGAGRKRQIAKGQCRAAALHRLFSGRSPDKPYRGGCVDVVTR